MRTRTIKPEFFRSPSLVRCSHSSRLTFEGLWCAADDAGRGVADPRILKGAIWPLEDAVTWEMVAAHLDELEETGHILRYAVDGKQFYEVVRFDAHQSASYRRGDPVHPAPGGVQPARVGVLEGKGKDRKGSTGRGATVCPDPFLVTDDLRAWASERAPHVDLTIEAEKMSNWARSKGVRRKDWTASFRNWCLKAETDAAKGKRREWYE